MSPLDQPAASPAVLTAAPLLGLATDVAMQVILARLPLTVGHLRRQFISFGAGLVVVLAVLWLLLRSLPLGPLDRVGYSVLHLGSYAFGGFCFFNVINLNISSLRIRMLKAYLQQHPRPLADEVLMATCSAAGMLDSRLQRLLDGGQITRSGDRFHPRPGFVTFIGGLFAHLRRLLLGR